MCSEHSWLWPPVRQQWGNQQTVTGLEQYLESCMSDEDLRSPDRGLWAAMAQLTPGPADLLLRPHQSLRAMAACVNPHLTTWLRDRWADQANVLTSDYFLGNNAVDIAVAANIQRGLALEEG